MEIKKNGGKQNYAQALGNYDRESYLLVLPMNPYVPKDDLYSFGLYLEEELPDFLKVREGMYYLNIFRKHNIRYPIPTFHPSTLVASKASSEKEQDLVLSVDYSDKRRDFESHVVSSGGYLIDPYSVTSQNKVKVIGTYYILNTHGNPISPPSFVDTLTSFACPTNPDFRRSISPLNVPRIFLDFGENILFPSVPPFPDFSTLMSIDPKQRTVAIAFNNGEKGGAFELSYTFTEETEKYIEKRKKRYSVLSIFYDGFGDKLPGKITFYDPQGTRKYLQIQYPTENNKVRPFYYNIGEQKIEELGDYERYQSTRRHAPYRGLVESFIIKYLDPIKTKKREELRTLLDQAQFKYPENAFTDKIIYDEQYNDVTNTIIFKIFFSKDLLDLKASDELKNSIFELCFYLIQLEIINEILDSFMNSNLR